MKNYLNCLRAFTGSHNFIYHEKPPSPETVQAKPASPEKTEKLEPKQVVETLKKAGFQNARLETKTEQHWKRHEHERQQPGIPRDALPPNHPDRETVSVEVTTYRFAYRGIDASFQVIQQEKGNVVLGFSTAEFGTVINAQDWDKALSKIKSAVEQKDPNFFKELMTKEGFKNVRFREQGEGGYPTYDFTLENGQKGNIVRVSDRSGFLLACNREDHGTFTVNAPTLAEAISKVMDRIKTPDIE